MRQPLAVHVKPKWVLWSLDFMSDCLYDGRRFSALNVLDGDVREGH